MYRDNGREGVKLISKGDYAQSSFRLLTVGYFGLIRRISLTYHVTARLVDMESSLSGVSDVCVCLSRQFLQGL